MTPSVQRALIVGLIIIGILFVAIFGLRTIHAFREFRGHRPPPPPAADAEQVETDVELIRDWMTITFVAKLYHVPPHILFDALGIPPNGNREKSLKELNSQYYPQAPGIVLEKIKAAVLANQSRQVPESPGTKTSPIKPIGPIPP